MTAPASPSPDSLAEVVAAVQSTADPIEQMLKVCSVSREHDLLISRTWVLAWAELWQAERAGRERLDAEMRKGITREDTDVVMPFDLYLKMTDADTKLTAENEMLRAQLAACESVVAAARAVADSPSSVGAHDRLIDAIASRAASDDISTPRPTDCADIREGRVTVLARDQNGEACMTMVPIHPWQGVGAVNQEEPPRS